MNSRHRRFVGLLVGWALWGVCLSARAQDPQVPVAAEENAAVQAIVDSNPATPTEWTRAAKILADLERPDLAKELLRRVLGAQLNQKQLAALEGQFGSAMFVQMASRRELAPEAGQLADAVLAAAANERADPGRLAALVKQLQDPSPEARYLAMDGLRRARGAAAGPLLAVLADAGRRAEHANVRAALVRLGTDAVGPLTGMLDAADPALRAEAIRELGLLESRPSMVFLLAPLAAEKGDPKVRAAAEEALGRMLREVPSKKRAAETLSKRARGYLETQEALAADEEDRVEVWTWDEAKKQPAVGEYPREHAYRIYAARLARDAYAVAPDDDRVRLLYLAAILEKAAHENGLDKPLPTSPGGPAAEAAALGVEVVQELLAFAMESGYTAAATAAARILGTESTAGKLLFEHARAAPLVLATRHADRRLRFAAVEAIMRLRPTGPFAGSSYVLEALGYFAGTRGNRRALVAGPSTQESLRVAGYLAGMGYEVDTATSGRGLIRLAVLSPDYELALVAASTDDPPPDLLVKQLRHDGRTAWLPVGLMARADQQGRADHMVRNDPLAEAFARPHEEEAVAAMVDRLLGLLGPRLVPYEVRHQQAAAALAWLSELAASDQKIYNMRRIEDAVLAAQYVPTLGPAAVEVLGGLGTPRSQRALVDLASRRPQPIALRRAAAAALGRSIRKHGILLTSSQIVLQYDRYNQSADQDADTQRVLAAILDSIEAPSRIKAEGEKDKAEGGRDKAEGEKEDG